MTTFSNNKKIVYFLTIKTTAMAMTLALKNKLTAVLPFSQKRTTKYQLCTGQWGKCYKYVYVCVYVDDASVYMCLILYDTVSVCFYRFLNTRLKILHCCNSFLIVCVCVYFMKMCVYMQVIQVN